MLRFIVFYIDENDVQLLVITVSSLTLTFSHDIIIIMPMMR